MSTAINSINPANEAGAISPLSTGQRFVGLDVLRGFAVLGILFMNIQGYGLISADYLNPIAQGPLSTANWFAWGFSHVFTEQKFMTLFCILFGAGIFIAAERLELRDERIWPPFLRRSVALLAIGMVHAYAIWYGDVLTTYAIAGVIPFLLRRRRARTLVIIGVAMLMLPSLYSIFMGLNFDRMAPVVRGELSAAWTPDAASIAAERTAYLGGWIEQMPRRFSDAFFVQTYFLLTLFLWRAAGLMLIGIALVKSGFLLGRASAATYRRTALVGLTLGLAVIAAGIAYNFSHEWKVQFSMYLGNQFNYWGSIGVSLGYASVVLLMVREGWLPRLQDKLAALGRATLTLYVLHSVLGSLLFYGHGFGLYDQVPRWGLLLMVVPIWALEFALVRYTSIGRGPLDYLVRAFAAGRGNRSARPLQPAL